MSDEREGLPSASGAEIFVNCAISSRLQALAPKEEVKDQVTTDGTLIHEALEREDGSELNLTQAEIFERLQELDKQLYRQWREDFPIKDKGEDIREERFWLYDPTWTRKLASAKADHVYIIGDHGLSIDYKSGFKEVRDASRNWQGRLQALVLAGNHPEVNHIRVAFAQGRLTKFYTTCDYTQEDLNWAYQEFELAGWRAKQPDAPATPGPWCPNCRAKSFCKAYASMSLLPSTMIHGGKIVDKADVALAVNSLSEEDLMAIFERRNVIENALEAIKGRVKSLPDETLKAHGYEKRPGARYITKVEVNPLFQALWDDGFWNHIPEVERQEWAVKEFSQVTTALTTKVEELVIPRYLSPHAHWENGMLKKVSSKRFATSKAAKEHLRGLLEKCSEMDTKEQTVRKIKE